MVASISLNFGVTCDGVAVIELRRLPELIDAVGGIEVVNPYAIYVPEFPEFSEGGPVRWSSLKALLSLMVRARWILCGRDSRTATVVE